MQNFGATYVTESHGFGTVTNIFPVEYDWNGGDYHGYMSVPEFLCDLLDIGIVTEDEAIQILNCNDTQSDTVCVSYIQRLPGANYFRVAVPSGTSTPADWPEPWYAEGADGEGWDNYEWETTIRPPDPQ